MKNIVWKRSDGVVAITHIIDQADSETDVPGHSSQDEAVLMIGRGDVPHGWEAAGFDAPVPSDRTFREAWAYVDSVEVDMTKAKEIWRDNIRAARKPILESLDVAFIRALETGDTELVGDIRAQKQALRDATDDPVIDAAATPEELKAATPEVLKSK